MMELSMILWGKKCLLNKTNQKSFHLCCCHHRTLNQSFMKKLVVTGVPGADQRYTRESLHFRKDLKHNSKLFPSRKKEHSTSTLVQHRKPPNVSQILSLRTRSGRF